jgi:hypothetical protein
MMGRNSCCGSTLLCAFSRAGSLYDKKPLGASVPRYLDSGELGGWPGMRHAAAHLAVKVHVIGPPGRPQRVLEQAQLRSRHIATSRLVAHWTGITVHGLWYFTQGGRSPRYC